MEQFIGARVSSVWNLPVRGTVQSVIDENTVMVIWDTGVLSLDHPDELVNVRMGAI